MLVADELDDRKTKTRALDVDTGVVGSVEAVEDPRNVLFGNADAVVFDCDVDLLVGDV